MHNVVGGFHRGRQGDRKMSLLVMKCARCGDRLKIDKDKEWDGLCTLCRHKDEVNQ